MASFLNFFVMLIIVVLKSHAGIYVIECITYTYDISLRLHTYVAKKTKFNDS